MARDNNIWSRMSRVHLKNFTPDLAVIVSTLLVSVMVVALPLFDVASAASLLFVLLFLQLNLAGITIHLKFPDIRWKYRIPFFPVTPLLAIVLYVFLAATMLQTNLTAWLVTMVWILLGLVNYFAYAARKGREQFEAEIVYEEQVRIGPKTGQRLLLPIMPTATFEDIAKRLETAVVIASRMKGEIIILMVHEVPQPLMLLDGATMTHDRQMLDNIKRWVEEFNEKTPGLDHDINFHNLVMVGRDITDTILEVVKMEDCDLLMLSWKGYTRVKGTVFGSKIDRILREAHCDLLVLKDPQPVSSIILAANPKGKNPSLKLIGEIYSALNAQYHPKTELFCVLGKEVPVYLKTDPTAVLGGLGLQKQDVQDIKFTSSSSITKALIEEVDSVSADLVIVGASKPKFLKDIRFGRIPESLAKHLEGSSLMIVKAHQTVAEAFGERLRDFLARRPKNLPPAPPV
jgi:nucleotide-binding universal stress UspA family protein